MTTESRAFFYINGNPTEGAWIDLDDVCEWQDVRNALEQEAGMPDDYDGDILVADAEGLARPFMGSHGSFDFDQFLDCRDHRAEDLAKIAYMDSRGSWDGEDFDERYQGEWNSEEDFAYHIVEECYDLAKTMGNLACYFDYQAFARDLFLGDYTYQDGHVFSED